MCRFLLRACVAALALGYAPVLAADKAPLETAQAAPYRAQVEDAMKRGRKMFLYDQAAWHATDQMMADFNGKPDLHMRGYVILPGEQENKLSAVFFGDVDGRHVEFARYEINVDKIVSGKVLAEGERPALSALAERLIAARDTAITEAIAQKYSFCNSQRPNYVILPPGEDGVISVYLLTPPTSNDSYPLGGHYRFDVGSDGKIISSRRFLNTCFEPNYRNAKDKDGKPMNPTAFFVTHLLDPQPTEIHIFASYYIPLLMMVGTTQNKLVWGISKGTCVEVSKLDDLPKPAD